MAVEFAAERPMFCVVKQEVPEGLPPNSTELIRVIVFADVLRVASKQELARLGRCTRTPGVFMRILNDATVAEQLDETDIVDFVVLKDGRMRGYLAGGSMKWNTFDLSSPEVQSLARAWRGADRVEKPSIPEASKTESRQGGQPSGGRVLGNFRRHIASDWQR